MKRLIKLLCLKALQIFSPIFLIVVGIVIGILPIIIYINAKSGWWLAGLILSIPIACVIVVIVSNFINWNDMWEFSDIDEARRLYKKKKINIRYGKKSLSAGN